jgi:formylglycine-generating enzyme
MSRIPGPRWLLPPTLFSPRLFRPLLLLLTASILAAPSGQGQESARHSDAAKSAANFENSLGMKMVLVPRGRFAMGAGKNEPARPDEILHKVTLSRGFYLAAYEVTVDQFKKFTEETGFVTDAERGGQEFEEGRPGGFMISEDDGVSRFRPGVSWKNVPWKQDGSHPAVFLSWNDARAFVDWLSKKEGRRYRLPTEAEWEYACRAGTKTAYWWGNEPDTAGIYANVGDQAFHRQFPTLLDMVAADDRAVFTSPVGSYRPNGFALYDMIGNAWEWVEDHYAPRMRAAVNPLTVDEVGDRVARGGGYATTSDRTRCSSRFHDLPNNRFSGTGFRVAMDVQ